MAVMMVVAVADKAEFVVEAEGNLYLEVEESHIWDLTLAHQARSTMADNFHIHHPNSPQLYSLSHRLQDCHC